VKEPHGMRKATPEGTRRLEAAQQALRDVISDTELTGKRRADAVSRGRRLVQFLEANADTRTPMETGSFKS